MATARRGLPRRELYQRTDHDLRVSNELHVYVDRIMSCAPGLDELPPFRTPHDMRTSQHSPRIHRVPSGRHSRRQRGKADHQAKLAWNLEMLSIRAVGTAKRGALFKRHPSTKFRANFALTVNRPNALELRKTEKWHQTPPEKTRRLAELFDLVPAHAISFARYGEFLSGMRLSRLSCG